MVKASAVMGALYDMGGRSPARLRCRSVSYAPPIATPSSSASPVIGICAALERAKWAVWDQPAALVPMNYIEHVQRGGGTAFLIAPDPALIEEPGRALDHIDGLLLVGGPDVESSRYGAEPHPLAEPPVELRDSVELALAREAMRRGLPTLGICRGMQIINVAAGGDLHQHLPESHDHEEHRRAIGRFAGNEHGLRLTPGSRTAAAEGDTPRPVASHHHQAVDNIGDGLTATGWADDDVVEAVESTGDAWLVGVQWHPEPDPDSRIIEALVRAAAAGEK